MQPSNGLHLRSVTQGLEVECRAAGGIPLDTCPANSLTGAALASSQALAVLLDLQEACKMTGERGSWGCVGGLDGPYTKLT